MSEKPLIETNPYLKDPKQYERLLLINIGSSAAIELGSFPVEITRELKTLRSQGIKPNKSRGFFGGLR